VESVNFVNFVNIPAIQIQRYRIFPGGDYFLARLYSIWTGFYTTSNKYKLHEEANLWKATGKFLKNFNEMFRFTDTFVSEGLAVAGNDLQRSAKEGYKTLGYQW